MRRQPRIASTTIALLLGPVLLRSSLPAPAAYSPLPILQGSLAVDHLKEQGLYGSLQEAVAAARYGVYQESGTSSEWLADNPAQQLRARFTTAGLQVDSPGDGRSQSLAMRLRGAGYGERQIAAMAGRLTASGARAEIHHVLQPGEFSRTRSEITEWYHNRAAGLEQGFTLQSAPGERRDGERLRVSLAVDGELRAVAVDDGQALEFKDDAGNRVLRYDHLVVTDGAGHQLQASMAVSEQGGEIWLEVDDRGAVWPVTIDPTFTYQQRLLPAGAAQFSQFGYSLAISGDTVVVGAQDYFVVPGCTGVGFIDPGCWPPLRPDEGSAYVFVRSNGAWTQQQKLRASDGGWSDGFGAAVAISGDRIVVVAPSRGAAYVFERTGGAWSEQHKLTAKNVEPFDAFGASVAISRDTIVVGAPRTDDRQLADTGSAYVFENTGGAWIQQVLVDHSPGAGDFFGWSVAISGDLLVVGAWGDDVFGPHGTATVFARSNGIWSWQETLLAADAAAGDQFGASVAISGTTVVVGAPGDDEFSLADPGSAYVFGGRGGIWWQQQKLINPSPASSDRFGASVATSGKLIVVGAPNDELFNYGRHGQAFVFESSGGVWGVPQWLMFVTGAPPRLPDQFGYSVAISGETVVVGAPSTYGVFPFPGAAGSAQYLAGSAHVFDSNTRPTIQAATVQRPSAFQGIRAVIATVSDTPDPQTALTVTVNGAANAAVNGLTISAIGVDAWGTVTADIAAFSGASDASFTLRVTDTTGLFAEATLVVRNLIINP